jgi:hypothetical protein
MNKISNNRKSLTALIPLEGYSAVTLKKGHEVSTRKQGYQNIEPKSFFFWIPIVLQTRALYDFKSVEIAARKKKKHVEKRKKRRKKVTIAELCTLSFMCMLLHELPQESLLAWPCPIRGSLLGPAMGRASRIL